jgi:hypothetical protein
MVWEVRRFDGKQVRRNLRPETIAHNGAIIDVRALAADS